MVQLKCFHGTSIKNGQSIIQENHFRVSDSQSLRMGVGAYFFCQAGDSSTYPIRCARELEHYHRSKGKHQDGYMILSCDIECEEENFLDLYSPESLEIFHSMRYAVLDKSLAADPNYKYLNSAVADTQVFDIIRKIRGLSVIRCPQYFGMLESEQKFAFSEGRQFPKTYVPNVIMACVDTEHAIVKNIQIVERSVYADGYAGII